MYYRATDFLGNPEFAAILGWPFADAFVGRLLRDDVPQRVWFGNCRIWKYSDPSGAFVGFGTLDVCEDYSQYTEGRPHPYIPLLAVNPTIKSLGYGTSIVKHLIAEAALLACGPNRSHDVLFLDVYTSSKQAIKVYAQCDFQQISPEPIPDPQEGGKTLSWPDAYPLR
ncbi:MAG TPA: GNAT family N-acetyltransferase, partial [Gemmataceae bacterium]|nr:GNAT family N-acetyltransferase [Gemmataceae bacterium]